MLIAGAFGVTETPNNLGGVFVKKEKDFLPAVSHAEQSDGCRASFGREKPCVYIYILLV